MSFYKPLFFQLRAEFIVDHWFGTSALPMEQNIYPLSRYYFRRVQNRTLRQRATVPTLCNENAFIKCTYKKN